MNFTDALKLLSQGKKIRRSHWHRNYFLKMNYKGQILEMNTQKNFPLKYQSTQGTDWEVFEEEKPKCKLCNETRELFMEGMCDLCFNYLTQRVNRICSEVCREVFK